MESRLLIATGAAAASAEELPADVRALIDEAETILVIAPRLPTRFEWLSSATDKATAQADERLHEVLGQLRDQDAKVRGAVSADDPLVGIEDAVGEFSPDHILIGLRSGGEADWQEQGLVEKVQNRFRIPITVFELPPESAD